MGFQHWFWQKDSCIKIKHSELLRTAERTGVPGCAYGWPYAIVINMTLPYIILKQTMAFPPSPVPLLDLRCEATELQLYLGLDLSLLKASGYPKRSKVDQIFPRPLHVTAKSPQAQGSILSSFPNFCFHWKCWYWNRSDFSKERKSNYELVQILFEMNECAS